MVIDLGGLLAGGLWIALAVVGIYGVAVGGWRAIAGRDREGFGLLLTGCVACVLAAFVVGRTTFGFAARIAGGNARAAAVQGLPVGQLILAFAAAGGAAAPAPRRGRAG